MLLLILLLRHRFFSFIKSWSQFPCFGIQVTQVDWEPEAQRLDNRRLKDPEFMTILRFLITHLCFLGRGF